MFVLKYFSVCEFDYHSVQGQLVTYTMSTVRQDTYSAICLGGSTLFNLYPTLSSFMLRPLFPPIAGVKHGNVCVGKEVIIILLFNFVNSLFVSSLFQTEYPPDLYRRAIAGTQMTTLQGA